MSDSQEQLVELVQSMTLHMKDYIKLGVLFFFFFYFLKKLLGEIEFLMDKKFDQLNKKNCSEFNEIKTQMMPKLTEMEEKISEFTSQINSLETTKRHELNASNTVDSNNACCQASIETAAFVRNTTTKINDINTTTLNISARLHEMNETIQNLSNLVVPTIESNISRPDGLLNSTTEPVQNVSDIFTTMEVNEPAPRECDHSQHEKCGTVAVVLENDYKVYTELSLRGRHTVVNMTSAGLQEYNTHFAVRGERVYLTLSSTSPRTDLFYEIGFTNVSGGNMIMYERLPTEFFGTTGVVNDIFTNNIISREKYVYYYVRISGDMLEMGRRGEPPLMTHTSTALRKLKYFSFMRGPNWGEALYDCPAE